MEEKKNAHSANDVCPLRNEAPKRRALRVRSSLQAGTGISKKGMSLTGISKKG